MRSHLDTVATGGKFDGPLGVIGGLEVIRSMKEQGIKTNAPLVLINWTNEEGARFFPLLRSPIVYAGRSTVEEAHGSLTHDGSGVTMGTELAKIGYVGDGEDGHANTYPMYGRRDALVGAAKIITELEMLAYERNGYTTMTKIRSGPWGACNLQSNVRLAFCLMHKEVAGLDLMGSDIEARAEVVAALHGLEFEMERDIYVPPGDFWPEAIDGVKSACVDEGIGSRTGTGQDSTMTTTLVPTAMVFV
ncbi:Fc.00g010790.m01.CDS01 [Cosmosporella sp. VM-42]